MIYALSRLLAIGAIYLLAGFSALSAARDASDPSSVLEREIVRLSAQSGGEVGVAAHLLGESSGIAIAGGDSFPMASTYKVPIAAYTFSLIDAGELSLEQMVTVEERQMSPSEPIAKFLLHPGISLSLHNLLELMLTRSDNTATDVIVELVGGGERVTQWLKENSISDMRVDRTTADLLRQYVGIEAPSDDSISVKTQLEQYYEGLEQAGLEDTADYAAFAADPQDHATPLAMNHLLTELWQGNLLSEASTQNLKEIMARCETGAGRLKGRLPEDVTVAHKTGTIGGTLNDVGVITLPEGKGEVVISVFIKNSTSEDWAPRDRAIADISRAVYDYYLFR